jgi:hypothetical protein
MPAGLRLTEGTQLQVSDIDSQRMLVRVRGGQGGQDRLVPMAPRVLALLRAYWPHARPRLWLFPARHQPTPLAPTSLPKPFTAVVRQSRIPNQASIHTRRHSEATHRLARGVSRRVSQEWLGHKSPRTTARYTPLTPPALDVVPATITALRADLSGGRRPVMPEMADVLWRSGREDLDRFGEHLLPSHRRALNAMVACRTAVLGGQLWQCEPCGQEPDVYHSCRNRSGPTGHRRETDVWLAERRQARLPVSYLHVVCTVPQELRASSRRQQQALDAILLRAAAQALMRLAMDPHDGGGLIGVLGGLHTWTRTLADHPHGHGLVPAGGGSADRTAWRPARTSSLVPVHALSQRVRGLFRALVGQERPDLTIPESVWTRGWVVSGNPPVPGPEQGLPYLGCYGHRIALPNRRMLALEDGHVGCRSQDSQDQRWKTMTLPAREFIRRLLPHVLPQGFPKVRDDGLWSPGHRPLRHHLQRWLAGREPDPPAASPDPETPPTDAWSPPRRAGQPCPHGGQG